MSDLPRVIGLGAGGNGRTTFEALRLSGAGELAGWLDPAGSGEVDGVPVLGDDDLLPSLPARGITHFFVGVGGVGDNSRKQAVYERALAAGLVPIRIVHPSAVLSPQASFGPGVTVMAGAIVQRGARIGANVLINTQAVIDHDCEVGDHAHVSMGVRLSGAVRVGTGAHIGTGASVRHSITIGARAIVGVGAVVVADVPSDTTVAGVPARPMERRPRQEFRT